MAIAQLATKNMIQVFNDFMLTRPKKFLSNMFTVRPGNVSDQDEVEIDIVRNGRRVAVDVTPGTGPRMNKSGRYQTRKYAVPLYDEADSVHAQDLLKRLAGETPYQQSGTMAKLQGSIIHKQIQLVDMIERAEELQAAQALTTGIITLTNQIQGSVSIDFQMRPTHLITVGTAWSNVAAGIIADLIAAGKVVREDGNVKIARLFCRGAVIENILNNTEIKARNLFTVSDRQTFVMPTDAPAGGTFHGIISAGDLRLELWSYDGFYENSSGTVTYYIPLDKVVLLPKQEELVFNKVFAGVPVILPAQNDPFAQALGLSALPGIVAGEKIPYFNLDYDNRALVAGVASRPLHVPTSIDAFATLDITS